MERFVIPKKEAIEPWSGDLIASDGDKKCKPNLTYPDKLKKTKYFTKMLMN